MRWQELQTLRQVGYRVEGIQVRGLGFGVYMRPSAWKILRSAAQKKMSASMTRSTVPVEYPKRFYASSLTPKPLLYTLKGSFPK